MKFDSYQRFIRSELYKSCVEAESKKQPLPFPGDSLDPDLRISPQVAPQPVASSSKLKKSLSNAEDRRRKSLLPWHRKARCKSKDRTEESNAAIAGPSTSTGGSTSTTTTTPLKQSQSDLHSSRSSLSSFDAVISSRQLASGGGGSQESADECSTSIVKSTLCRIILPDCATTIVQTRDSETIREMVDRLLDKRGLFYSAYEGYLGDSTTRTVNLDVPSQILAGQEMTLEPRIVFKVDLPNRKIISVRSKTTKKLGEVLQPILKKYGYLMDMVEVYDRGSDVRLYTNVAISTVDGLRLLVVSRFLEETPQQLQSPTRSPEKSSVTISPVASYHSIQSPTVPSRPGLFHQSSLTSPSTPGPSQTNLDEITNKVFNELLQQKVDAHSQEMLPSHSQSTSKTMAQLASSDGRLSDDGGAKSDDWCSESSSGIFGRLRNPLPKGFQVANKNRKCVVLPATGSITPTIDTITDTLKSTVISTSNNPQMREGTSGGCLAKKPLIAKWKTGVKLQSTTTATTSATATASTSAAAAAAAATNSDNNGECLIVDRFPPPC